MTERSEHQHQVSIPVDDLEPLSRHLDGVADNIDASMRRLRLDASETALNDNDAGFSLSRFGSRMLSVVDGAKRTTAHLRATAALVADTSERAITADRVGADRAQADTASPSLTGVVEQLSGYRPNSSEENKTSTSSPNWEQVWDQVGDQIEDQASSKTQLD